VLTRLKDARCDHLIFGFGDCEERLSLGEAEIRLNLLIASLSPMPLAPPVISATFPASLIAASLAWKPSVSVDHTAYR
jgi:hypothetical protein